jgi:hypothetical protein
MGGPGFFVAADFAPLIGNCMWSIPLRALIGQIWPAARASSWNGNNRNTIYCARAGSDEHPAQERRLATLLPGPLACCRWELERRRMIPPSNFALRIIVEEDPRLVRDLNARYAGAAHDGGLENVERDALFDVLGKHFTGRPWPLSGGMDVTRRFMADLQSGMIATRWKVDLLAMA